MITGPVGDDRRYSVATLDGHPAPVGGGGEGLVFRAVGLVNGTQVDVALKMLTSVPVSDYGRVVSRTAALADINHPHLLDHVETFIGTALRPADDVDPQLEDFDVVYTVPRSVPGVSLSDAAAAASAATRLRWIGELATAVQFLHDIRTENAPNGVLHRDMEQPFKPGDRPMRP